MKKIGLIYWMIISSTILSANGLVIPFSLNGKIGFLNENLNCIIQPQYIGEVSSFSKQLILLSCDRYDVLVCSDGKQLHRGVDGIFIIGDDKYAVSQHDGNEFIRVYSSEGKQINYYDKIRAYMADKKGNIFIDDYNYDTGSRLNILNENGELIFKKNTFKRILGYNKELKIAFVQNSDFDDCLIDELGNSINTASFKFGKRSFNEGFIFGKNLKTNECGFFNMNCECVIKADIKNDSTMDDWNCYPSVNCGVVALVNDGEKNILLSEWQTLHSDNWSIVDVQGNFLGYGLTADYIYPFSDDVAVLVVKLNDKNNYYLINKNGNYVTEEAFDEIKSSVNGYCMARKNGIDYLISSKNGQIIKCEDLQ